MAKSTKVGLTLSTGVLLTVLCTLNIIGGNKLLVGLTGSIAVLNLSTAVWLLAKK